MPVWLGKEIQEVLWSRISRKYEAVVLRGGMLLITFSTGEQRLFDTTLLTGSAFEPLKDEKTLADFSWCHDMVER